MVSDYLWHGQTQTWGKPAVQVGIEADHASGFYAGFWGSNVSSHWLPNANLETDWTVGFRNTFATDFRYDIGGLYVYYPGGNFDKASIGKVGVGGAQVYSSSKLNTVELYASLGWKWFTVKGGFNPTKFYGWNGNNSGVVGVGANTPSFAGDTTAGVDKGGNTKGSGYVMVSGSYDLPMGFNISGQVGRQMIADSTNLDWTWYSAGVTKSFDGGWSVNGTVSATSGTNAYHSFISFDNTSDTKTVDKTTGFITLTKSF